MGHPHIEQPVTVCVGAVLNTLKQSRMTACTHFSVTKFTHQATLDFAAKLRGHGLHAVADTQYRDTEFEHNLRGTSGVCISDGGVAAGQVASKVNTVPAAGKAAFGPATLVNLLPVFPLDGGQIFRELLRWKFPRQGDVLCFTVSMVVGIAVAMIGLALNYLFNFGIFMALLFGSMAWQNYQFRKIALLSRDHSEEDDEQPRQAWERDADWWKKG